MDKRTKDKIRDVIMEHYQPRFLSPAGMRERSRAEKCADEIVEVIEGRHPWFRTTYPDWDEETCARKR
jgi:hypothetical protein